MRIGTIIHQVGRYTVRKARKGYAVYQEGATAAVRVATYGSEGPSWLARAVDDADRRATADRRGDQS